MIHIVRSDTPLSAVMIENDLVKSVLQNILLIVSTRKGTVPMYREFGIPMEWIDKPIDVAQALMVSEITEAIEEFEPRCKLVDIEFDLNAVSSAKLTAIMEVEISDEQE